MRNVSRLSKKAVEYLELSGYDVNEIKKLMKTDSFAVQVCETVQEMEDEGLDSNYPYVIWDPYNQL